MANKRAVKEMTMELEGWCVVMEAKKKRWEGIVLLLPRLSAVGVGSGSGVGRVEGSGVVAC